VLLTTEQHAAALCNYAGQHTMPKATFHIKYKLQASECLPKQQEVSGTTLVQCATYTSAASNLLGSGFTLGCRHECWVMRDKHLGVVFVR